MPPTVSHETIGGVKIIIRLVCPPCRPLWPFVGFSGAAGTDTQAGAFRPRWGGVGLVSELTPNSPIINSYITIIAKQIVVLVTTIHLP